LLGSAIVPWKPAVFRVEGNNSVGNLRHVVLGLGLLRR
jgi:hypothetical protein